MGLLEADTIKQVEMTEKITTKYLGWTRKLIDTKVCKRILIKAINTLGVPLVRYSEPFIKLAKKELRRIYQRKRKLMTIHKAFHLKDYINMHNVTRNKGVREPNSSENSVDASLWGVVDYCCISIKWANETLSYKNISLILFL